MKGLLIANTNYSLRRIFTAKNSEWRWLSACWLVKEFQAEAPIAMTNHQRTVKTNGSLRTWQKLVKAGQEGILTMNRIKYQRK